MRSITHSKSDNIKTKLEQRKKKAIWFINIHDTKLLQILEKLKVMEEGFYCCPL